MISTTPTALPQTPALVAPAPIIVVGGEDEAVLRTPCARVAGIDDALCGDIARAAATLGGFRRGHGFGRALAAPQIGIARRFIIFDLGAGPFAVINPKILWRSEETFELWDDCLSVPDLIVRVRRHRSISIEYRDEQFRLRKWCQLPPDLSELVQHEIDHLDGVVMTDRATAPDAMRPIGERSALIDRARPRHRLDLDRIAAAMDDIDPVFLHAPQIATEPLSELFGCALTVKIETLNPVRSFKGRGADLFIHRLAARGELGPLVCGSAGNFGQALAYACRVRGIPLTVFAATNANPLKIDRMRALGADVHLTGRDFDAAKQAARQWADEAGARMVEDGREPAISEGAGTVAVELLARDPAFDAVLVPLGNGALLAGASRWIKAASPATRTIGVVSEGAPAMAHAWRAGPGAAAKAHPWADTIADGIAVREPIPEAIADMHGVVDDVVAVPDAAIVEAMRLIHRHIGVVVEPAGAVGVAAITSFGQRYRGLNVATVLTGSNLTPEQAQNWLGLA